MIYSGANIIDIGGKSTRPGSKTVNPEIEWKRVKYVIERFKKKYKKTCLSIDTRKSDLMTKSIKYGADLINDVSGFNFDKASLGKLKSIMLQKFFIICKGNQTQCKKILSMKMFC